MEGKAKDVVSWQTRHPTMVAILVAGALKRPFMAPYTKLTLRDGTVKFQRHWG